MGALSLDLRERIVAALRDDPMSTYPQVAARFSVSVRTIERLWSKACAGESLAPRYSTGRTPKVTPDQWAAFEELAASRTDWTLQSLGTAWQEQTGVALSGATVSRHLARLRFSHKKRVASLPNETKPNAKPLSRT